jgi:3-dehydrosphinganine reductase
VRPQPICEDRGAITSQQPFDGKIAFVCGGSKGIGRETVKEFVRLGGSVLIVARTQEPLLDAAREADGLRTSPDQFVETLACDTRDMESLKPAFEDLIARHRAPDYLFNVVGYAYPQYIQKLTLADFVENMDVNYYGQLIPILILLPHLIEARRGHIANVSSASGIYGSMGYATYAPTKFAIVGLSQCLRNELKPYNIKVSVLYPPDTETPGFENENKTKPLPVTIMSERVRLMQPEDVAREFVQGVLRGDFNIFPGSTRLWWIAYRLFPGLINWIVDRDYQRALERVKAASTGN